MYCVYVGGTAALLCVVSVLLFLCRFMLLGQSHHHFLVAPLFAPKKDNIQRSSFCGQNVYKGPHSIKEVFRVYEWIEKLRKSHASVMHEEARCLFMATNKNT
jgi:hypothetical protein